MIHVTGFPVGWSTREGCLHISLASSNDELFYSAAIRRATIRRQQISSHKEYSNRTENANHDPPIPLIIDTFIFPFHLYQPVLSPPSLVYPLRPPSLLLPDLFDRSSSYLDVFDDLAFLDFRWPES
ncbi:unnamed protein product [Zymoseptoria tritici ST99CH_3D7]|uniref:Uncharacterized protein n=1 Tax=Zymoseptoria tritici (strain ST99CH_3D7) TaxID=1276538 RepID=A0A1X7RRI8_ZYMT9|nr:unnamed protein product [Zymoseptoria tritici ST99CH_3D7]